MWDNIYLISHENRQYLFHVQTSSLTYFMAWVQSNFIECNFRVKYTMHVCALVSIFYTKCYLCILKEMLGVRLKLTTFILRDGHSAFCANKAWALSEACWVQIVELRGRCMGEPTWGEDSNFNRLLKYVPSTRCNPSQWKGLQTLCHSAAHLFIRDLTW